MSKSSLDEVTNEKVSKGGILAKLYFDMQDTDKARLQPLMVNLINEHLLKERGVAYCYGAVEEPLEKDKVFITSAQVTMLFDSLPALINIAFNYSPAGVEILKPDRELVVKVNELQSIILEISQTSFNYSKYVLEKVLKPEELDDIKKQMEARAELGKRFMHDKPEDKKQ
jgi:hypothetical protein